jgi:DNA modification methylase
MYNYSNGAMQIDPRNKINDLTNEEWVPRMSSINSTKEEVQNFLKIYPQLEALRLSLIKTYGHNIAEQLCGNIAPPVAAFPAIMPNAFDLEHPASYDKREIKSYIELMTKKGDLVLDPMVGSGTTLEVCYQTGRVGGGIELMDQWYQLAIKRLSTIIGSPYKYAMGNQSLKNGDCRDILPTIKPERFDFIITSPPYYNIMNDPKGSRAQARKAQGLPVTYGDSDKQLGKIGSYPNFMKEMGEIYFLCDRVLKPGKYMVIIVADIFADKRFIPYHSDTINIIHAMTSLRICGIQVVLDHWKKCAGYGLPRRLDFNFHHHYALIFQKPEKKILH